MARRDEKVTGGAVPGTRGAVIIVIAGLLAYWTSFDGQFILDDHKHILENRPIRDLANMSDLIRHSRRPVVNVSLAVNYALGELEVWGYHAVNLAVHLLAGLTLFGVVRRTFFGPRMRKRYGQGAAGLGLAVALIWVVHPLQTQSVTYIIQRGECMMGLFYLLTLYCFIRGVASSSGHLWHALAVGACALSMGSKAVAVTAPVMVLLYDRAFVAGSVVAALRARFGLYAGLAGTWIVLLLCGVITGVLDSAPKPLATMGFAFQAVSPAEYAATQPGVILHYLRLSLLPYGLCLDYMWPVAREASRVLLPAVPAAALAAGTLWALWRRPAIGFVGCWFFLILAPTSSFVPIQDLAFEHRMYLPLAAVVVLVVVGTRRLFQWGVERRVWPVGVGSKAGSALVALSVIALGYATFERNKVYHSVQGMWQDVLAKRPEHARAHSALGVLFVARGEIDAAVDHFTHSLQFAPEAAETHFNMAVALGQLKRTDDAIAHYRRALSLQPTLHVAHNNLGVLLQRQGRLEEAETHCRRAVTLGPGDPDGHFNLGNVLFRQGKTDEAIRCFAEVLRLDPSFESARTNLAAAQEISRLQKAKGVLAGD